MRIAPLVCLGVLLAASALVGCGETSSVSYRCGSDDDCAGGVCIGGACVPVEDDVATFEDTAPTRDIGTADTAGSDDVATDTPPTDSGAPDVPGQDTGAEDTGRSCIADIDCEDGEVCALVDGSPRCLDRCDPDCPDGFACANVTRPDGATVPACVPVRPDECVDADENGYGVGPNCLGTDCDDARDTVHEGREEMCDEIDNDCDGMVDEAVSFENGCGGCTLLAGDPGSPCGRCGTGAWVCADDESVVCTGESDETILNACGGCDPLEAEPGDACGACGDGTVECVDEATVRCAGARPPPPELCNGADDDCDEVIDEGNPEGGAACTTPDPGVCSAGSQTCVGGTLSCQPDTPSSTEICDGLDNDCDALTDEGVLGTFYQDSDGDGAGNPDVIRRACTAPPGYVAVAGDCNDARGDVIAGECAPGTTRSAACGNCGTRTETCSLSCTWAASGSCSGEGECAPGARTSEGCGTCARRVCSASCSWADACTECACSSVTQCGYSCPAGYHSRAVGESLSCGSAGFGPNVTCAPNCGSSFTACGYSCPDGYYVSSVGESLSCGRSGFGANTSCRIVSGSSITVCGFSCPDGYVPVASGDSLACGRSGFGRNTTCRRL